MLGHREGAVLAARRGVGRCRGVAVDRRHRQHEAGLLHNRVCDKGEGKASCVHREHGEQGNVAA
eukprot:CAMPEP_0170742750 /NCGR_PEP_ID=MMETSP0437-20130122/6906_1 /TAXON_ID=0 /ORGANISM="Sexangularia sp." /LENGTH=63 /DNA_ID=CAMNT_0011081383 /DNA_START=127 /DNA_END=318 /DNA_ORIENTATION=+